MGSEGYIPNRSSPMKSKTYNSKTVEVTYEKAKIKVIMTQTYETELDSPFEATEIKEYPDAQPVELKKAWFSRPSLSDALLGAIVSPALYIGMQFLGQYMGY